MSGPVTAAVTAHVVEHNGLTRRYLLAATGTPTVSRRRLVIDLHGSGFTPDDELRVSGSASFAMRGAIVVAPEAAIPFTLRPGWPAGFAWNVPGSPLPGENRPRQGPDDVAFLVALAAQVLSRFDIGSGPLHLMGHSGGARLASHVAATVTGIASVGLVAGARFPQQPIRPPAILAVHGTIDNLNPYAGGAGTRWDASVPESVGNWAAAAGCQGPARARTIEPGVTEHRYERADGTSPVRLVTVEGVGHAWPGSRDAAHAQRFGPTGRFDATGALWDFFCENS